MDREHPVVFIHTEDTVLATRLVRLLNQQGISGFWVTEDVAMQEKAQVPTTNSTSALRYRFARRLCGGIDFPSVNPLIVVLVICEIGTHSSNL